MKSDYVHAVIPELSGAFLDKGSVRVGPGPEAGAERPLEVAVSTLHLALRLGIRPPASSRPDELPYGRRNATLVYKAPLLSAITNKKLAYLRGWSEFGSCIKGFNALGLMAEHVLEEYVRLKALPVPEQAALKREFLASRRDGNGALFSPAQLAQAGETEFFALDNRDLAVWRCFAGRTIVCSTSSNMGISTHQALRLMQQTRLKFLGKEFALLNETEGSLIIWCPDERADFMDREKTQLLRGLERELPKLTSLRTYINRQQRDPGALKDALLAGGYFFPTNPQSKDEMQNLIFVALSEIGKEGGRPTAAVLEDPNVRRTLESLGCEIQRDQVIVRRGVESGIYGLMLPYIIMLEQLLAHEPGRAVSAWNQASIGAALAGAALADKTLRDCAQWPDDLRSAFNSFFPALSRFLDTRRLGKDVMTQIHGVFDIANLQSLAQLLGVVVEDHLSGRGTAYVGLGSSSYSNGNRCIEILRESMSGGGAFRGKTAFHPATHTMNPFAQALIFGEDLHRFLRHRGASARCSDHVKKPEPAGAAALAGYLLSRLDMRTLSIMELAYGLRLTGFSQASFLEFAGYGSGGQGMRDFLQLANEEGALMGRFAQNMLLLLGWGLPELERKMWLEKKQSRIRYWLEPLDDIAFEYLDGPTCLYLTGDNAAQVSPELLLTLSSACEANLPRIDLFLAETAKHLPMKRLSAPVDLACLSLYGTARAVNSLSAKMENLGRRLAHYMISRNGF